MIRYKRRYWLFAAALSALAGFVDANGFVCLGGYFVSFMSGNSTRLGVSLASYPHTAVAGGLIFLFVLGVIAGALLNRAGDKVGSLRVLWCVTAALTSSSLLAGLGVTHIAIASLAVAMGAMNAVFQRDGEVSIGVTYMTGALVRMGQRMALALTGGPKWEWASYALLWVGLIAGAAFGALGYHAFGLADLWIAAAAGALLAMVFARIAA
jgi:uncharacterized membrane protein YoaK (UPF0700 family)